MSTPLANRLADYACQLRFEDLPKETVHETKRRFLDSIATAVGAMDAEAYAIARRCGRHAAEHPARDPLRRRPEQCRVGDVRQRLVDPLSRCQ